MISVYITFPDEESAKDLAKKLLKSNLIACANILPSLSLYKWKGEIKEEAEVVMFVKTREEHWEKLKEQIRKFHPYEIPAIIKFPVELDPEYGKWIKEETQPSGNHS